MADDLVDRVANELAEGKAVDWPATLSAAKTPQEREALEALRLIQQLTGRNCVASPIDQPAATSASPASTASADTTPVPTSPGRMWGRYRLEEEIGSGSFGTVYRASDPALNFNVAIKVLRQHVSDELPKERLLEEGRTLAKISHQNVVRVLGVEFKGDRVGLCTEFILGDTIEDEVRHRGTFSELQAIEVGKALCQALAAVHRAGFVHRDVKARNTMRERDTGRIVLMDFGTGRGVIDELRSKRKGIEGTATYMAPEILAGQPASFSSDVYSIGVLLYYVLTGTYPVEGGTLDELKAAHLAGQHTPLGDRRPDLSPAFIRVVELALSTKQKRYATPGALAKELENVLSDRRPVWLKYLLTGAMGLAGMVAGLAFLGFVNTTYLEKALGIKEFTLLYTPFDHTGVYGWIFWGSKAALAPTVLALGVAFALTVLFEFERLAARASTRVRTLERSALVLVHRWSLHQIDVVSSLSLLASAAVLVGTTWYFAPLLGTFTNTMDLSTVPADRVTLLSLEHRDYQMLYRESYIAAGIICVALWYPAVRLAMRTRQRIPARTLFAGAIVMAFIVLTCLGSSDRSLLENGASLRGPAFSDQNQSDSAAGSIAFRAYSLGLSPLRAR